MTPDPMHVATQTIIQIAWYDWPWFLTMTACAVYGFATVLTRLIVRLLDSILARRLAKDMAGLRIRDALHDIR